MWHICEEYYAGGTDWSKPLKEYCIALARKFPMDQSQVDKWYRVCQLQFPIYVTYWEQHPDVKARTPLLQEVSFKVPYVLPSGRTVLMRGKWDSVDLIGEGREAGIYLQENKTKGDPNEEAIERQLTFDLQTMWYLTALQSYCDQHEDVGFNLHGKRLKGVRYNVIRRPLSGGKGSIVQGKGTDGASAT